MRLACAILGLFGMLGSSCGPEEPGPRPTVFVDASVVPTEARSLSICESACRRLEELACPNASAPRGDCNEACRSVYEIARIAADPACIVRARSCEEIERCQGR